MSSTYKKVLPVESKANIIGGSLDATDLTFGVVVARFNFEITDKLLEGAIRAFDKYNIPGGEIKIVYVPGAFELPIMAKKLALSGEYSAIICLGAVIRGDTSHYDYVCSAATEGVLRVGLETMVPVIFGVLTCDNELQALDRVKDDETNKGFEAVETAIWTANVLK